MAGDVCYNHKRRAQAPVVPEILTTGTPLWKWDGNDQMGVPLIFKVDPDGFYLSARGEKNKEALYWDINLISDVRVSESSGNLKEKLIRGDTDDEDIGNCILQLVYRKDGIVNLDFITLVAQNGEVANSWMIAVNSLTHNLYQFNCTMETMIKKMRAKLMLYANGYGHLYLNRVNKILTGKAENRLESITFSLQIHKIPIKQDNAGCDYIEADTLSEAVMEEMISRVANCKDHVQRAFQGYKVPNMNEDKLLKFLNEVQRDPRDNEVLNEFHKMSKAISIIHNLEPKGRDIGKISPVGMWRFLASEESNMVDMTQMGLAMDMTQPLSHYFINSSHNTYCSGAQINGQSSVEIYRQCLLIGCRCIELDCWIQNDDIIITHGVVSGLWVCTTISFEKVLRAINDFAFVTSDYPLILSIENHVDRPHLLSRMASLYTLIFGDKLLKDPIEGYPIEPGATLPSPEMLRGKILLKDKIRLKKLRERDRTVQDDQKSAGTTIEEEDENINNSASEQGSTTSPTSEHGGDEENRTMSPPLAGGTASTDNGTTSPPAATSDSRTTSPPTTVTSDDGSGGGTPTKMREKDDTLGDIPTPSKKVSLDQQKEQVPQQKQTQRGSISISVRLSSTSSNSSLGGTGINKTTSSSSISSVPSITVNTVEVTPITSPDESKGICILSEDDSKWPAHVTFDNEWIVDDSTLRRPPKKKGSIDSMKKLFDPIANKGHSQVHLSESCPAGQLKDSESDEESASLMLSTGSTKSDGQVDMLSLPSHYQRAASEGMALVAGPIIELLNYCTAVKFESFEAAEKVNHSNHVCSLDEEKAMQNLLEHPIHFVKFNARQFSRIYPAGKRINSSNYPPQLYWDAGCQMVALNYQTSDLSMQLNCGKFEQNLGCGYLLKPSVLRSALAKPFNIFEQQRFENIVPLKIRVKVLSGLFLSDRQNMVNIETLGLPADTVCKGNRTRYQAGPHPKWENPDEDFVFEKIILPDLSLIRFSVTDDRENLVGQRVLPLSMIRSGYRFVLLRDKHSQPLLLSSLFVYIKVENFVPENMEVIVDTLTNPTARKPTVTSSSAEPAKNERSPSIVEQLMMSSSGNKKRDQSLMGLALIPQEDQMLLEVKSRNMTAIKPKDNVVQNHKKMTQFYKKAEKELGKLKDRHKTRLAQFKQEHSKKKKSAENKGEDQIKAEEAQLVADHKQQTTQLESQLIEERYREMVMVLSIQHEDQVKGLRKTQIKEEEKYKKLIVSVYSNQISTKHKDRIGEAAIKHQRLEVSRKCTEKIQELQALHQKEVETLMDNQKKIQEQLMEDKEKELKQQQQPPPPPVVPVASPDVPEANTNNNNGNKSEWVWDF
ncbi:1-phosphatidylinositol 4,5-bisphosphate phosphodiesterase beta-4-like isoform X2 [Dysidea avara]|uniref:1-phosphatidylinositol 4,5-bisphosphate phosphodiesterase beta-4-like isoform X2 n=1 Tax=Dysidea avara TaxID=196820 RepID=UPI00331B241A